MTFMESVQTCVKQKYAAFSGRASRSEYWFFSIYRAWRDCFELDRWRFRHYDRVQSNNSRQK